MMSPPEPPATVRRRGSRRTAGAGAAGQMIAVVPARQAFAPSAVIAPASSAPSMTDSVEAELRFSELLGGRAWPG